MSVQVFDKFGNEKDWAWLQAEFGAVEHWQAPPGPAIRLVQVWESDDIPKGMQDKVVKRWPGVGVEQAAPEAPAILMAHVMDEDGNPLPGVKVARRWPYKEFNPKLELLPEGLATWFDRGVHGPTNENGDIGFGMGGGDFYWPPAPGASTMWCEGGALDAPGSDAFYGLGMVGGTNHRTLRLVFQVMADEPPDPPPDPPPVEEIREQLLAALDALGQVRGALDQVQDAVDQALALLDGDSGGAPAPVKGGPAPIGSKVGRRP